MRCVCPCLAFVPARALLSPEMCTCPPEPRQVLFRRWPNSQPTTNQMDTLQQLAPMFLGLCFPSRRKEQHLPSDHRLTKVTWEVDVARTF